MSRLLALSKTYRDLFSETTSVNLLDSVAPTTFGLIRQSLFETMVFGVCRTLIDKESARTLGLDLLVASLPKQNEELERQLSRLRGKYDNLRLLRNKLLGHRDETTAYAIAYGEEHSVRDVTDHMVISAIADMADLFNGIAKSLRLGTVYEGDIMGPDAGSLLQALRPGLHDKKESAV